ncbi:MAG: hypothetical protein ABIP75_01530 [Pyrinomonadaceae bacterium]
MSLASPENVEFARRLIATEATNSSLAGTTANVPLRVIEGLRIHLVRLSGIDGFRSLLSRALMLAKAEVPSLAAITVGRTGSLEGFERIEEFPDAGTAGQILVAHFLGLLVTFIGESLTFRLVLDQWPDASVEGVESGAKEIL